MALDFFLNLEKSMRSNSHDLHLADCFELSKFKVVQYLGNFADLPEAIEAALKLGYSCQITCLWCIEQLRWERFRER